jgi:flagellar protein FliO/FliZ
MKALLLLGMQVLCVEKISAAPTAEVISRESRIVSSADLLQWATGLGIVIVLILMCAWFLKRLNRFSMNGSPRLKILSGISVGSRERVLLVQAGEAQLVLGVAPGRVQTLHILDQPEGVTATESDDNSATKKSFSERMQGVLGHGST